MRFRNAVTVYTKQENGTLQNHSLVSRNVSRGGLAALGQVADLPEEVVISLGQNEKEPVFLSCRVVRKQAVSNDWHDYGLLFLGKTTCPTTETVPV